MSDSAVPQPALAHLPEFEHPFKPGELLDHRFRIVREVAQGGMGIVFEAVDEKLERRIAIKCAKLAYRGQLPREVRSATEVSHPNVCKIFEIHTARTPYGDIDFITMEFLEGETLSARLRRGSMADREAREIAGQICAGLGEAHRIGVIHGDLKTNNVILAKGSLVKGTKDSKLRAVITDFGLAHRPDAQPGTVFSGPAGGTRGYMSPELLNGGRASMASDIYALGVVLTELALGCKPAARTLATASDETVTISAGATIKENKAPGKTAPVGSRWERIISRCLKIDPAQRYASAEEVKRALEASSATRRRLLVLTGVAALAFISAAITYERTAAPKTTVRLALLPFEVDPAIDAADVNGGKLTEAVASALANVNGSEATGFSLLKGRTGASYLLKASISLAASQPDIASGLGFLLDAHLIDAKTGVEKREWKALYAPGEIRYMGTALAGFVTGTFALPALPAGPLREAARRDLEAGLTAVRRASGADRALPSLLRAVEEDPDSPLTYAALAEAQWFKFVATRDRSWVLQAAKSVRQAELRNPDLAPVLRVSGLMKYDSGRYELARADYRRAIQLDPANGDAFRRLGMAFEADRQLQDAQSAYHQAIAVASGDYRNHQQLGAFEDSQGNYDEAVRHYEQAVRLAPDEPEPHRVLGDEYQSLGKTGEAERELRDSLKIAETPVALHSLGVVLMYQGRDRDAIPYLKRALQISPNRFLLLVNLSIACRRSGSMPESHEAIHKGLDLVDFEIRKNPMNRYNRSIFAYLLARNGDRERAKSEIEQSLQLPPDAKTQFLAAATYEALDRRDEALSLLNSAPKQVLEDLNRWPDVAKLRGDTRFIQLLASRRDKVERQ